MNPVPKLQRASLAEGQWVWRRLYVYLCTMLIWVLLRDALHRAPADQVQRFAEGLMGLLALMSLLYLVAPSAQQVVNLARGHKEGGQ
ncbi:MULTISPECIES: hypothetical protein [unclassified Brevundimonas]|uniref:hypothetical protein n=1 Tax=unclassified Brevundimonas TaxID=2622653 RepID=UPI0025C5212D|nr:MULTISPECIES: hypothetical protein [unclassified Brevundimonas]